MSALRVIAFLGAALMFSAGASAASAVDQASAIARMLDQYVPDAMRAAGVPGISIAVVEGGKIVLARAYGVDDVLTRGPVRSDTLFQVASNGKFVAAYAALRQVDARKLSLDRPLSTYLSEPWTTAPGGDRITLRQVLSHSSGLSNQIWPPDRALHSPPGRFSYSGVGFVYLQRVLETVGGGPIDSVIGGLEFQPLGMSSASFEGRHALDGPVALGHAPAWTFETLFVFPCLLLWLVLLAIAALGRRIIRGSWRLSRIAIAACGVLAVTSCSVLYAFALAPAYLWTMLAVLGAILAAAGLSFSVSRSVLALTGLVSPHLRRAAFGAAVAVTAAASFLSSAVKVPVAPARPAAGNVAFSLCATASDMARLVIEIMQPRLLSRETAREMLTPQVHIDSGVSWGLGVGLYRDEPASFSQWGSNIGYESIVVGIPSRQSGVVVLANASGSLPLLRRIAQKILASNTAWSIAAPRVDPPMRR